MIAQCYYAILLISTRAKLFGHLAHSRQTLPSIALSPTSCQLLSDLTCIDGGVRKKTRALYTACRPRYSVHKCEDNKLMLCTLRNTWHADFPTSRL